MVAGFFVLEVQLRYKSTVYIFHYCGWDEDIIEYAIVDTRGIILQSGKIEKSKEVSISELESGFYFFELIDASSNTWTYIPFIKIDH
jgi:hypothetical protein